MEKDPEKRADIKAIKAHAFFEEVDWETINTKKPPSLRNLKFKKEEAKRLSFLKNMIKEGIVQKKSPWWYYNTRRLKLYATPKLEYLEPVTNEVRGVINLNIECEAILKSNSEFHVKTPKRTFEFIVIW